MTSLSALPIFSAPDIAHATGGATHGTWQTSVIRFDTRIIKPGDVFIALKSSDYPRLRGNANADGHNYIGSAFKNGAVGAIVEKVPSEFASNDPRFVVVKSTYQALIDLGITARTRMNGPVIGITGSVGKTSTREMMARVLKNFGKTHSSDENYNNIQGVPYTLANAPINTDYMVVEMGMDCGGELTPLTKMARPTIAIITTVAPAHMENFDNGIDGIADAKSEIFLGLIPGGTAIINRDMSTFARVLGNARTASVTKILTFGEHPESDARMINCVEARNGTKVTARIIDEDIIFHIPAGKHQATNALAVLLTVKTMGLSVATAAQKLAEFTPVEGRGREEYLNIGDPNNPVVLIDESYNASPAAMNAAFRVVALIDPGRGGRRIAILGDMLELGDQAPRLHSDLAIPIRAANIDLVYTCGTLMKHLHDALPANNRGAHRDTSSDLAQIVPDVLVPGDVVVVKGSKSSRMDVVVQALRALPTRAASAQTTQNKQTEENRHAL